MSNNKPSHELFVSEKVGEKTYYHKVGAIWPVAKGGLSIKLVPNVSVSGQLVAFPPKNGD